ncbi:hypothetical protein FACS1894140_6660 [Spirochaetia bacterium]|nr:hypothetical protein FACS1894140_6660 [Spirochaetia bacterium]
MAKIDFPDPAASFLNPASYGAVKAETKKPQDKFSVQKGRNSRFSSILETSREETAAELGALQKLPVSEETVNQLLDDVRSAGDDLRNRPFPEEIIRYKRAVHDFLYYVKENAYAVEEQAGVPNYLKPRYKGPRGTPKSQDRTGFHIIQVVDKKLEEMAARILSDQMNQLELLARLEEITGLLVDLLQ